MELSEILPALTEWLPAENHKERTIKGGSKWFYLPFQAIVARLNEVCPGHWSTRYTLSHMEGDAPIYLCELTICGNTRTGIGDKSNEPSPYGTPAQRAFRKAFTDAAEQFGLGSYLDEQTSEKTKRDFVRYMQQAGNGKAAVFYQQQRQGSGEGSSSGSSDRTATTDNLPPRTSPVISDAQRKRLYAIATNEGRYTDAGFRRLVESAGFASSKDITKAAYDKLCERAKDPIEGSALNREAANVPVEAPF